MTLVPALRIVVALSANDLTNGRGRVVYLIVTLAIAAAAWLLLAALAEPFVGGGAGTTGSRVTLRNGSQTTAALPLRYAPRIEAIHGARGVAWFGMQGAKCTSATMVTLGAWGGPGTDAQLRQQKVGHALIQRWNTDPLGAVISTGAVSKCGWQVGEGVDPPKATDSKPIELHIMGTFRGTQPVAYVHYDYLNRVGSLQGKDKVVYYVATAGNPRHNELLAARIEAEFAHDFPTINATTNATTRNAWARFGKAQELLAFVMAAVLLCAASVLISVLAHVVVERKSRFALLQVLGFQRAMLFGAFALELLAIVVLGALVGIGLAKLVGHELAPTTFGFLAGGVRVPPWAWWGLPAWLAALVLVSLAWPAAVISRVRPVDYRAI